MVLIRQRGMYEQEEHILPTAQVSTTPHCDLGRIIVH